ncbi:MAG: stage II sporulation protein D [Oscillospiraceae bacterium]|nr:stage II sporulation protein D [Oscillospiraceae bacterium]
MKACIAASVLLMVLLFGVPWLRYAPEKGQEEVPQPLSAAADVIRVWDGEKTLEMTMEEYLPGVVRGEMPASFEMEALKAQAVAERTYIYYKMADGGKPNHPDANVCMSSACCSAYTSAETAAAKWGSRAAEYESRIQKAVQETAGQVMLYGGEPIFAAFHSSSDGVTANSGDVWVSDLPYLASVASPEGADNVPNYYSTVTFSAEEFQQKFKAAHAEAVFGEDPQGWITDPVRNRSDRVETVTIGGVTVEGTEVRSIFALRSASFTAEATADSVTFRVTGYGHGVGMSQYGANELARQGKTWQEILHWYYTGISIESYVQTR